MPAKNGHYKYSRRVFIDQKGDFVFTHLLSKSHSIKVPYYLKKIIKIVRLVI